MPLKDIKVYEVHFEVDSVGSAQNFVLLLISQCTKLTKNIVTELVRNAKDKKIIERTNMN